MILRPQQPNQKKHIPILTNTSGIMLVELLIVLALLSLVLAIGFSVYSYTSTSFSRGENRVMAQSNLREAANFIVQEVRYATELEILKEMPAEFEVDDKNRYIYVENGVLKHRAIEKTIENDIEVEKEVIKDIYGGLGKNEDVIEGINFSTRNAAHKNMLDFQIFGRYAEAEYEVESSIQILNIDPAVSPGGIVVDDTDPRDGIAVRYTLDANTKSFSQFLFKIDADGVSHGDNGVVADYRGYINNSNHTISVGVPLIANSNLNNLIAHFVLAGERVTVGGELQVSGETVNDFSAPVTYRVFAENGSFQDWVVTVTTNPPEVAGLRLRNNDYSPVFNTGEPVYAEYAYFCNGNGDDDSIFVWEKSERISEEVWGPWEPIGEPKSLAEGGNVFTPGAAEAGHRVRLRITPRSVSDVEGVEVVSDRIFINDNPFWNVLVTNLWYTDLLANEALGEGHPDWDPDKAEEKQKFDDYRAENGLPPYEVSTKIWDEMKKDQYDFKVIPNIETNSVVIDGVGEASGAYYSIDLEPYVTDIDSYTVTFDARLKRNNDDYVTQGWGITFNANLNESNQDAGYMYQFDPGARGFVFRRNNYGHLVIPDLGVRKDGETNSGSAATYRPSRINNANFDWTGGDDGGNENWFEDYTSEITVQRQLDHSMIFRVRTWETARGRENMAEEMWFGDFGELTYEHAGDSHTFIGQDDLTSNHSLYGFPNSIGGTHLGFRSWAPRSNDRRFRAEFNALELSDGFAMAIDGATFLVYIDEDNGNKKLCNTVKVVFSDDIRLRNDNLVELSSLISFSNPAWPGIKELSIENDDQGRPRILLINFYELIPEGDLPANEHAESPHSITVARGGVRHVRAGDINITNGNGFILTGYEETDEEPDTEDLLLMTDNPVKARLNKPYSFTFESLGGMRPHVFTVDPDDLPAGLELTAGGILEGTPTDYGTGSYTFEVTVTDAAEETDSHIFTLPFYFIFYDDFNRDTLGDDWTLNSGTAELLEKDGDKRLSLIAGSGNTRGWVTLNESNDSRLIEFKWYSDRDYSNRSDLRLKFLANGTLNTSASWSQTGYQIQWEIWQSGDPLRLYRVSGASSTLLASYDGLNRNDDGNTWHDMKIEISDTDIKVYHNGTLIMESTDTTYRGEGQLVLGAREDGGRVWYGNVRVEE